MRNRNNIERTARRTLADEVRLVDDIDIDGKSLSRWQGVKKLPRHSIAVLELEDRAIEVSSDLNAFGRLVAELSPVSVGPNDLLGYIRMIQPGRCRVLETGFELLSLLPLGAVWKEPSIFEGALTLYCNDFSTGTIEKIVIERVNNKWQLQHESVSQGLKFTLR